MVIVKSFKLTCSLIPPSGVDGNNTSTNLTNYQSMRKIVPCVNYLIRIRSELALVLTPRFGRSCIHDLTCFKGFEGKGSFFFPGETQYTTALIIARDSGCKAVAQIPLIKDNTKWLVSLSYTDSLSRCHVL